MVPPSVNIDIEHHFTSKVYTTGSVIAGHIAIRTDNDFPIEDVKISLDGMIWKRLELSHLRHCSRSEWCFLRVNVPVDQQYLPQSGILQANKDHCIPFELTVPDQLPLGICTAARHSCIDSALEDQHHRLLPTMGFWEKNDFSPELTSIAYYVKVRVVSRPRNPVADVQCQRMVNILPATPSEPPISITPADKQFQLSQTSSVRWHGAGKLLGCLTVNAHQPPSIMLSSDGKTSSSSMLHLNFRFESTSKDLQLPKLKCIAGKLVSHTYYGRDFISSWPHLGSRATTCPNDTPILDYDATLPLFEQCLENTNWASEKRARPTENVQGEPGSTSPTAGCVQHTASLSVPFHLPVEGDRFTLPTFHSCHFSRTYTLELVICTQFGFRGTRLAVPLHIGVENSWGSSPHGGPLRMIQTESDIPTPEYGFEEEGSPHMESRNPPEYTRFN